MENIVTVVFKVESQAYQAFSEVKADPYGESYLISGLALVKKQNGHIVLQDSFGVGVEALDDTAMGGLIGGFIGIIGGPIGMLLGGGVGLLAGSAVGTKQEDTNVTLAEKVTISMKEGDAALIALVQEKDLVSLDSKFKAFDTSILRRDAAIVQDEVKEAARIQRELAKQTKKDLSAKKSEERKAKIEKQKEKIKQAFDEFKQKQPKLKGAKSISK